MENNTSHYSSCISPAAETSSMSAGESSWAMHIANFLASPYNSQEMCQEPVISGSSSFSSGFSSSFATSYDDASFITSEMMCDDDDDDDSLQDTACSSAAAPKLTSNLNNVDMKSMATMEAKDINITQLAKYFVDASSRQPAAEVLQETVSVDNNNDKSLYECNELRKKGLCLVPLSMLINYLG
ncbi:uncharacterized protein [Oryza sativa Japonica Group]|uniref:Os04g0627300 protein n=8 Tax=Oryza TaxID=4527 RepID=B9FCM8_ORYSJ|nr:uncharacterized protein LOC4337076 [Oryza sativa Japonica Group]XP_052153860.1 uncharacterized protein LOC127771946 [Oryza glaberrima]EEC78063.1 hypothetical protein OsI_17522 [Oryza sativa Indica Group]KAB8097052.1 hypothetical protein EE612_025705 [Oryza sativa]EEE61733.1 hypothetical protein OsJ_16254 [Oryza sativa Japonica Group]KAF2935985.1 hypothetical protein DAI22_04g271300 [Oryza sativa Japonica Group]BAS91130.1 Os04g0627300 [Oryza sativa Japonica Group]